MLYFIVKCSYVQYCDISCIASGATQIFNWMPIQKLQVAMGTNYDTDSQPWNWDEEQGILGSVW